MKRRIALATFLTLAMGCGRTENSLLLLDKLPDVKSIHIHGNKAFSEGTLKSLMVLSEGKWWNPFKDHKYREAQLQTDLGAITTFYTRRGYLRATVQNYTVRESKGGKVAIDITLSEGEPVTVKEVAIRGVPADLHKELEKSIGLKAGAPMDPYLMTADRALIIDILADKGYWETQDTTGAQYFGNEAIVFHNVTLGHRDILHDLTVSGNKRLDSHAVLRDISVKEGEVLERKQLLKSQTRLLESGYYYDARWDTTGRDTVQHRINVDFNVRERPVHWIEGGVGLSSTSQLRLSGEWGTRNFLRTGTRFAINSRTDFDIASRVPGPIDEHRTDLIWNMRGLFGSPWEGQPNTFYRYDPQVVVVSAPATPPSYTQQFIGIGFNMRRKFGDLRNQLVFSLENQWIWNQADSAAEAADPQLARDTYTQRLVSGWIERDTRNSFFDPTRGSYFYDLGQVGWGALGGSGGFAKLDGSAIHIVRLPVRSIVMVGRIQGGYIWPTSNDTIVSGQRIHTRAELVPTQDRFILGGGTTIRGYQQDELNGLAPGDSLANLAGGGLSKLMANVELRAPLFWRLGLVGFLDIGNVWQNPSTLDLGDFVPHFDRNKVESDDVRYTYGLGLRFATPVGPVRVDYAWKWNFPQDPVGAQESRRSAWHVGIGQAY
jgi:outer membrane protein assembly complex protein YaeT